MLLILLFNFFSFKSKYPLEKSFLMNEKMIKFQKQSEFYDVHNIHPLISGTCGPNLNYFLESNHLIITGTGEMINYSPDNYPPWYNDQTSVYNVSIEDGVVSIGEYAFYDTSLSEDSHIRPLADLGKEAFGNNPNIKRY